MASSRSPSPATGDASEPSSPQLSPRSKLQAMLAAVDDNSDDEESGPIDVKALFKSADKSSISPKEAQPTTQNDEDDDDDGSEDEDEIMRPRGRLASRMQANTTNEARDTSKTPDDAVHHEAAQTENEDNEDDVSALPRRRIARPARSLSPEPTVDADQPPSPGLFVSPSKSTTSHHSGAGSDSENDFPADLAKSERFKALVARKRQERLAKEAEEARKQKERAARVAETMPADPDSDDDISDITDDDGGRQLTQRGPRAPRKASKKALEEMNRETQRLNRSLQLAHEAKTKKRISKSSLFERFNFRPDGAPVESKPASSSRPSTPVSHQTDVEMGDAGTPPSSPPLPDNHKSTTNPSVAPTAPAKPAVEDEDDDDILDIAAALARKGKGKAVATATGPSPQKSALPKPRRQVRVKLPSVQTNLVTIDSDDELEITDTKKTKVDAIFNRLPNRAKQDSTSMNALRRLANLSSPPREPSNRGRKGKPSMTVAELQMSLQQRARAQAKLERERRVEYLRSKGINVQTEEERQKERDQVEDIVARARQEVEEIMEREREEAKQARKDRKKNGEDDPLGWDDSDDDSFQASGDEEAPEIELSGSEEEDENEGTDADGVDDEEPAANPMFEEEAEDEDSEKEDTPKPTMEDGKEVSDEEDELPTMRRRRSKKQPQVVSDDDDGDDEVKATPKRKTTSANSPSQHDSGSPKIPTSVLRSATKSFIPGLPVPAAGPAGLGLTQIFAGTMDDSQAGPSSGFPQEFMPSLNEFPDSQFSAAAGQSQIDDKVPNSQSTQNNITQGHGAETQGVQLHFTQSQGHGFDSLMQMDNTQMSELIEPTQDSGYQDFTPLKRRFVDAPHSTMDTVMLGGTASEDMVQESPLLKRKGKLRRRGEASLSISSLPPADVPGSPSAAPSATITTDDVTMSTESSENAKQSAFRLMEKAAKRKKRRQDKLKAKMSEAKEWVEQEADESEDEYAGLGGADGEDSSDDDEELAKEMIDDAAGNDVDEAKLAGFYADRERAADAAQVDKLFRDITTGMLRKRRRGGGGGDGNDLDLSDSDDGGEAKRRMKRRQFAKMQKALFADERIGKIAENPRNAAFLKSIEDRGSDDEWDFGENFAADAEESSESQSQAQQQQPQEEAAEAIPDSQPTNAGRKRSRTDDAAPRQPVPNARRTAAARDGAGARPASLTEVRRSLSTLLDDPNTLISSSIIPATELGDSEGEEGDDGDDHRRSSASSGNKENTRRSSVAVVDRITLKRSSSSNLSSGSARLAFAAPSNAGAVAGGNSSSSSASNNGTFKVPALLRKATTNSLISNSSAGSSTSSSNNNNNNHNNAGGNSSSSSSAGQKKPGFGEEAKLKKTAGRGSGVNYFARETERRAAVAEAEKRREKRKWKGVEGQKKAVRGLFGSGTFE